MRRSNRPMAGLVLAVYGVLLRSMPAGFRARFEAESLRDLERMLARAEASGDRTVRRVAVRACWDLLKRLPAEWWASARTRSAATTIGPRRGSPGTGERMMDLMREMRRAARTLSKKPGFTAVAILTLALGIGANVAIFAIVDGVLLEPLPYEASDRIVEIRHHAPGLGFHELRNSAGMLAFYAETVDLYEATAAFDRGWTNLAGADGAAARVPRSAVAPEIFDVLRIRPVLGRPFTASDAQPGAAPVALLAHGTWQTRFGGNPSVVGRTVEMDGATVEVVGVMPEGFAFPDNDPELYTPLYVDPAGPFGTFGLSAVSRLAPGVTVEAAGRRSTEALARLPDFFPDLEASFLDDSGFTVSVATLRDRLVVDVESTLWIIMATVAFVLLIACANVANLFMVRAESRQKEMAVRAAMGAGRLSVAASFLSESVLLGMAGGLVGVALATASIPLLLALAELPRAAEVSIDAASLAFAAILSVVVGLTFGALPLTRYAGSRFAAILRDGSRGSTGGRERHRARNALVATQLALGLVLLVGSGLMLRSFAELRAVDPGIDPEGVLTLAVNRNAGEESELAARFFQDARDRLAGLPGVASVGIATSIPLAGGDYNGGSFYIESRPRQDGELPPTAMYRGVGGDYFASLGISVVSGRTMERADWEEGRAVVWVNETFERTHLGGDAIGERIAWDVGDDGPTAGTRWAEVVGVVADVREFDLADENPVANAYLPIRARGGTEIDARSAYLVVKMQEGHDPSSLAPAARAEVRTLDSQVPITATRTMDDIVAEEMESMSATMIVLAVATGMALFLGAIGLAGVISYVVGQRTREIGVRVALGATSADVRGMILRQSMTVTIVGTVLGLVAALGLTRLMGALLFEVSTTDPLTFTTAPLVLVSVSLLATWLPVRRATRVDPTEALRSD